MDKQANQKYQCKKCRRQFDPFFKQKADSFKSQLNLQSDDWHADETVVFINGERYYKVLPNTLHIPVAPMSSDTNNNLTPAEVAGFASDSCKRNSWFVAA